MSGLFQWLYDAIAGLFQWIIGQVVTVLENFGLWVFDGLLAIADWAVASIPSGNLTTLPTISGLPADIVGLFGYVGGFTALGILASAYILRIPLSFVLKS